MYRVLVVDDEKLEREGIRFLLSMEEGEWEIYEAANGKLALNELRKHPVDLMLTDIKMPHMDGLELSKKAREEYPDLEIIIFSGYGDFAFAQEAIRYGVTDYVLKPVDPDRFHDTIQKIQKEIASRKNKEQQSIKEKSFLQQYFLLGYIYSGDQERLKEAEGIVDFSVWEQWHCAILIESDEAFFDSASDEVPLEIREELRRSFFYLNLNGRQSLLLFKDVYCDYVLVAKNVYNLLKRLHPVRFHLAVSRRFDGYQELPEIMEQLEQQMEEKFYHPDIHVYTSEEDEEKNTGEEEQDSRLMEKISEDISRKDVKQLWSHFRSLASKYQSNTQFSAMYVKFVFSNVIRELFQENRFAGEHRLDLEVDHLYGCSTIQEIIEVTEKNIRQYEEFLDRSMSESRDEVAAVKNYIYNHYAEDLNLETLAEKVYLSSGYLSFIFKKETGMNLNRFIRVFRMEKAKELLRTTNMKVAMVSEQVGFANSSYFCRSFREYYGSSPRNPIGKETMRMKRLLKKYNDMKYRYKLTILLVVVSLVPMTVLALYSHSRMSSLVRKNEMEDMYSILEQTRESIDGQIEIYASLLNYLTYSPEIQEVIFNKDMDRYTAYEQYTEVVDPLLTVPQSYHEAILGIQLFAESIPVRHEYTLAPLSEVDEEWWSDKLKNNVTVQWIVDRDNRQIAAVREIYDGKIREAVLCISLDYGKVFQPLANIIERNSGGFVVDDQQNIVYHGENLAASDISAQKETAKKLDRLREEYTYVSSSGHETRWTYYFYKPPAVIESSVSKVLISEIPLIGFCVVIIIVLGMTFSKLFTRKIEQLTRNMEQVNQGSREVTVYSDSGDEVGQLVRSFHHMMDEINRLIEEVYENKIALKEFELKALTAQINPHFLYNSLSIINWMAIKSRQKEISRVTLALSTFYRTALSKGADMVTVETCIRNIEAYLEIQLIMHDNDFKVEWKIDPSVQQELVPKLALQPIVENALEHGLDVKEEGEKLLKLYFFEENGDVVIRVEDNGIGMEQEQAEKLLTYQAKGYGLKNVNDRMCILYGEKYAIRILSKVGKGTSVDMRIPKEVKKDET